MKQFHTIFLIFITTTFYLQASSTHTSLHDLRKNAIWTAIQGPQSAREFLDEYQGNNRDCIAKALGFLPYDKTYIKLLTKFGFSNEEPKSFKMPAFKK